MSRTTQITRAVFYLNSVFLVLLLFSFRFVDPGSAAHVAAVLSMIPILLTFVFVFILTHNQWDPLDF